MIKSIKKATDLLFLLSNTPEEPITLGKLAAAMHMNNATCSHILETLCDSLLVERVSRKEGYRLGPGAYMLTRYDRYQQSLVEVCSPIVKWLTRQLNVTVFLSVVCDGIKYVIYHTDVDARIDYRNSRIVQGNLESTASGILMMAYMDSESLNRVIYRSRQHLTLEKVEGMRDQYKRIRRNGYASLCTSDGEGNETKSYAFSIFNGGRRPIAAIGVLYPNALDAPEMRDRVISHGRYAANEISRRLKLSNELLADPDSQAVE